jgi:hypothetical protein
MHPKRAIPILAATAAFVAAGGCRDHPTAPPPLASPPAEGTLGSALMEVTISGIGSPNPNAAARAVHSTGGPALSLAPPADGSGGGDGTIQLRPLSTGSFTVGTRGDGGERYLYATFAVRNAQSDGTAYDTPRSNLTFVAVSTGSTLQASAVTSMRRFDGTAADASIALGVMPTGAVHQGRDGGVVARFPDVLQAFTEAEVAAIDAPAGSVPLPYGFVVASATEQSSRTLPASPAADQFDGVVTFAFRIPLQPTAAADPFTVSIMVMAMEDSTTRVTQSIEEQGAGQAAFEQRAASLGATSVTLFGGGTYVGLASPRRICELRVAGPPGAPTATLSSGAPCSETGMNVNWLGVVSTDWWNPRNWGSEMLPLSTDTVTLGAAERYPALGDRDLELATLIVPDTATLDMSGRVLTLTGNLDAPLGRLLDGTLRLLGEGATMRGTMDALDVAGSVRTVGASRATGAIHVTGSLTIHDHPLSISIP